MTGETQTGWKAKFPEEAADLEWWEAAFGEGNIAGWTGRSRAVVKLSGTLREVDPALREWAVEARALVPALDTVLEAVEAMDDAELAAVSKAYRQSGVAMDMPVGRLQTQILAMLHALRAEQHSASGARGGGETEGGS